MEMEHLLQYFQNDRMFQCLPMANLQGTKLPCRGSLCKGGNIMKVVAEYGINFGYTEATKMMEEHAKTWSSYTEAHPVEP